jgi:hypothetical protein
MGIALTSISSGGNSVNSIGGYRIHTFTSVGSATFTLNYAENIEYLIVAGGGGGGGATQGLGGNGGSGIVIIRYIIA